MQGLRPESGRRECLATGLGFVLLSFAFSYPLGLSDRVFLRGDPEYQYLPYMLRAFHPVADNVAGPWDPTHFTGLPESHFPLGRYYPPVLFLFTFFDPVRAFGLGIVLHQAMAGWGTYQLVRAAGRSRAGSWLAGIMFSCGGFLIFHRGHCAMYQTAAWLPWVLWALERFRRSGSWVYVLLGGTFVALQGLGGHMQAFLLSTSGWVAYGVYYLLVGPGTALQRRTFALGGVVLALLGAAGSLPQMLPLMEVAHWSAYQDFRLGFSSDGNLNLRHLVAFLNPWLLTDAQTDTSPGGYMGLTEQGVFQGFLGVALVLTVIFWLWRRAPLPRDVAFWVLLLTVQLLVMLGKAVHLHRVMALIPVYRLFHIPTRHVLVVGLAMSWLAALGLDLLLREEPARRRQLFRRTALGVAGLTLAALGMCVRMPYWPQGAPGLTYPPYWMMLGSAVAALILLRGVSRGRVGLATLVPVLTAVELWCYLHDFGMSPQAPLCYRQPQAFPDWVQWLRHQEQAGRPARYLVQNDLGSPGRSLPTAWGSGWGLSALDVYCNSMPAGLCRLLHLDGYGAAHFPAVFGEQRGLSAAGGQYIYAVAPLPAVAPHRGYCRYQACHLIWFRDGFGVSTPALLNSSGQEPTGDQEPGLIEAGTPSRLNLSGKKSAAWLGRLLELPAGSYLVDGQVACPGPWQGRLQVQLRTGPRHDERLLAEQVFEAGQDWGKALPFVFRFDHLGAPEEYRVSLRVESAAPVELTRLDWWQLQPDFAHRGPADPGEMCRCLHAGMQPIYPEVADFPPGKIYRNPEARDLVTLIEEVRPAADPLAAADALLAAERPVRELAYVIAPGGRSGNQDWTSPRKFAPGAARVLNSDPSDIRVRTTTAGEGFALFTVTRCWGWSATVDGQAAVLHAVDGPFMGVVVPAGVHEVRLVYRPLLVWIGMAVAGGVLGGAWLVWVVGRPRVGVMPGPVWALFSTVRRCSGLEYNQGRGRQHPYRRAEMERVDLEAVYENGTLKLPYPLPLEAGQRVMVTIHTIEATPRRRALIQWQGSWEDLEELILSDENDPLEAS